MALSERERDVVCLCLCTLVALCVCLWIRRTPSVLNFHGCMVWVSSFSCSMWMIAESYVHVCTGAFKCIKPRGARVNACTVSWLEPPFGLVCVCMCIPVIWECALCACAMNIWCAAQYSWGWKIERGTGREADREVGVQGRFKSSDNSLWP